MVAKSPLAPESFPALPPLAGVRLAACAAGVRYKGRTDVTLIETVPGTTAAGVFTRSLTASAPVHWCRRGIAAGGAARAVVVNSGNSNAFTGAAGDRAAEATAVAAAEMLGCVPEAVYLASTGVIGELLPHQRIVDALPNLRGQLDADRWEAAAEAIRTTDTFAKGATRTARIGDAVVRINGIAKGSGMIAPDMATMLSFLFTDATLPADVLQACLKAAADKSFNCVTVDGDTSTSDTLMLFATGAGPDHPPVTSAADPALRGFRRALTDLCIDLAKQLARDGEGASRFATVTVTGAASNKAAHRIAMTIANSPLVKTAIAGADANWGRIVMAVGKAGEKADRDTLSIRIGGVQVAKNGVAVPDYDETPVAQHMKGLEVAFEVDIGIGKGKATVWTCDLTHGYIDINADYRT